MLKKINNLKPHLQDSLALLAKIAADISCGRRDTRYCAYDRNAWQILEILQAKGLMIVTRAQARGCPLYAYRLNINGGRPILREIIVLSSPGRHVYIKCEKFAQMHTYEYHTIVSTSYGIMTIEKAIEVGAGGFLLARLFY